MNLYFRLFIMFFTSLFKSKISLFDDHSKTHRVLINDLDLFFHMNNGRYFTITDLARIETLLRSGVWKKMKKRGVYPIMAGESVQFFKPLTLFQKYEIKTKTLGWDEKYIYHEHKFISKDQLCSLMIGRSRIIGDRGVRISPAEFYEMAGEIEIKPVKMNPVIEKWKESINQHCESGRCEKCA